MAMWREADGDQDRIRRRLVNLEGARTIEVVAGEGGQRFTLVAVFADGARFTLMNGTADAVNARYAELVAAAQ